MRCLCFENDMNYTYDDDVWHGLWSIFHSKLWSLMEHTRLPPIHSWCHCFDMIQQSHSLLLNREKMREKNCSLFECGSFFYICVTNMNFVILMLIFHSLIKLNSSYAEFVEPPSETEKESEKLRIVEFPRIERKN